MGHRSQVQQKIETIKYLTPEELLALLTYAKNTSIRNYAILLTSVYHGLRISEIGRLQLKDWNTDSKQLYVRRLKGGIPAHYKCHDDVTKALTKWVSIRGKLPGALFVSTQSTLDTDAEPEGDKLYKGIGKRGLDHIFNAYAEKVRLPDGKGIPEDKRHFHVLRHTCAVNMVNKGIPLIQIADWLGHRNINSTMIYAKVSDAARNTTAEQFYADKETDTKREKEKRLKTEGVKWAKDSRR